MKKLTSRTFKDEIFNLENNEWKITTPSVIKFFIENCEGCDIMKPIFDSLEKDSININFYEMKLGSDLKVAEKFNIVNLPAFVVLKTDGNFLKIEGQMPKIVLLRKIENFLEN